jgi:RNA 3'-terminal phosphate cyclase (ATP)
VEAKVGPWSRPRSLDLTERGALVSIRGLAGASRLKNSVAQRLCDAASEVLWEQRRLQAAWEVLDVPGASPGAFIQVEAVFERSRAAYSFIVERGTRAEVLGARAARTLLHFLDAEGAVDSCLADQLAVPLALSGGGGTVTTDQVGRHLEAVADVVSSFGIPARTWGRPGGPGGLEIGRS